MPPKMKGSPQDEENSSNRRKRPYTKESHEYKEKRARNNVAVKKSREKTRQKAKDTQDKVEKLKMENAALEQKVQILSKELSVLKDLFLTHAGSVSSPAYEKDNGGKFGMKKEKSMIKEETDEEEVFSIFYITPDGNPVNTDAVEKDHEYTSMKKGKC